MTSRNAHANSWYFDFQGGASQFRATETLFGSGTADASDLGVGFHLGLFYDMPVAPGTTLQFGLQHRVSTATQSGYYYAMQAPYAVVRLQILSAYASAGFALIVLRRATQDPGLDAFGPTPAVKAFLTDAGILYSATPKFSLGGSLGLQWLYPGRLSLDPVVDVTFVMRFYFGFSSGGSSNTAGSRKTPVEYDGWRYIGK